MSNPDPQVLRQLLDYDPATGELRWKPRTAEIAGDGGRAKQFNSALAGKPAMTANSNGYRVGGILGTQYLAHRVIWAMHYGRWPETHVDHINGDRMDNRICNLREATFSQNNMNRGAQINNTSGFKGVSWHKRANCWRADIRKNGKQIHLGSFGTREAAYAAYCQAVDLHHGEFGRAA